MSRGQSPLRECHELAQKVARPGVPQIGACFCRGVPRSPRAHVAGGIFHVTSRGNRKADVFLDDPARLRFLQMLTRTITRSGWRCLAYCLMTNHFHLVVDMEKPTLSEGMHWLNGCYAQWFNRRYGFKGHLFEDRFHSEPVESDAHLLELSRYLPLNPVRAGLCSHPSEWPWSSYREMLGRERTGFLSTGPMLALFGRTRETARAAYDGFVRDGLSRLHQERAWGTVPRTWPD